MNYIKISLITFIVLAVFSCSKDDENPIDPNPDPSADIQFVTVPSNETVLEFEMSATEISYQQYVDFLNDAFKANFITYNSSDETVRDGQGNTMTSLKGSRVVKDHNGNGVYELEEMENPLNINFITFNESTQTFEIEDPSTIDWSSYFNPQQYPNVVDSINDWYELSGNASGFHGEGDTDGEIPSLEEIKTWPANFIRYYGAHAFAEYYNYDLPTLAQWHLAGEGGNNFEYATSDGTGSTTIAWIGNDVPGWPPHKGHVQPVNSKSPNPLGIYNLGGNVWEWVKDWHDPNGPTSGIPPRPTDDAFFIDDNLALATGAITYKKGLMGGSFNYFVATMKNSWNHSAFLHAGNDHFGFRVVKNE